MSNDVYSVFVLSVLVSNDMYSVFVVSVLVSNDMYSVFGEFLRVMTCTVCLW